MKRLSSYRAFDDIEYRLFNLPHCAIGGEIFGSPARDRIDTDVECHSRSFDDKSKYFDFVDPTGFAFYRRLPILPSLEMKVETLLRKRQVADGDFVAFLLHRKYVEILQQSGYR